MTTAVTRVAKAADAATSLTSTVVSPSSSAGAPVGQAVGALAETVTMAVERRHGSQSAAQSQSLVQGCCEALCS